MRYTVKPHDVCPTSLSFDLEGDVVKNVEFVRGCNGNLKAISKLVDGMTVDQIESVLRGNTCGNRNTSCADQLAQAVRRCYDESCGK
ncbi:MAG: TIGR03905 family TSCPD domain-containing protein [Eubacteriales bacterium]|nr:TIGR03905 family TSCPD domain-containing protein [Eubacteriales bacterium]